MFKRHFLLILGFGLMVNVLLADPAIEAIRKVAQSNVDALEKGDYEVLVKTSYPKLVEMLGGREQMVSAIKRGMEAMAANGLKITSITIGQPSPVVSSGDKMYSVVPTNTVVSAPNAKISQNSYLLAVSSDKGGSWTLMDGSGITPESLAKLIPDFPADLKLPAKSEPVIEKTTSKSP